MDTSRKVRLFFTSAGRVSPWAVCSVRSSSGCLRSYSCCFLTSSGSLTKNMTTARAAAIMPATMANSGKKLT